MEQQPTPFEALQAATEKAGGQSALSRICSVSPTAVWKWLQSAKRLPAEYVLRVEAATGISRHLLRPDIYPRDTASLSASAIGEETPLCGPILSARTLARHGNRHPILPGKDAA
ncbi:MAG: transcriptional regulator [Sphingobium sp.]